MLFQEELYHRLRARLLSDAMRLTEELIEQPALMQEAVEAASDAIQIRDVAKSTVSIAESRAMLKLRVAVDELTSKPYSEKRIESMIPLDPDVAIAVEELEEAKHSAAYWQGLVDSFGERGSSLRRVADLTNSGYLTPNAAYADRRAEMSEQRAERAKFRPR